MTITPNAARENLWQEFTDITRTIRTLERTLKLVRTPYLRDFLSKQLQDLRVAKAALEAQLAF